MLIIMLLSSSLTHFVSIFLFSSIPANIQLLKATIEALEKGVKYVQS